LIVDSSILVALALDEPDSQALLEKLRAADVVGIGAPTLVETGIVLSRRLAGDGAVDLLTRMVAMMGAVVLDFGPDHWAEAIRAWERFGRARHPASLNFGDCLAYAAARVAGQPLLAKGDNFRQTDLELV
jgi:ribonuclease VapC